MKQRSGRLTGVRTAGTTLLPGTTFVCPRNAMTWCKEARSAWLVLQNRNFIFAAAYIGFACSADGTANPPASLAMGGKIGHLRFPCTRNVPLPRRRWAWLKTPRTTRTPVISLSALLKRNRAERQGSASSRRDSWVPRHRSVMENGFRRSSFPTRTGGAVRRTKPPSLGSAPGRDVCSRTSPCSLGSSTRWCRA